MLSLRRSAERGFVQQGWLESHHSFSFAEYYDPMHMGFSVLRVINEDIISAGAGFGMHPHQDMEIITYMLAGELRHQDSLGHSAVIKAGDVQHMTAGTGVRHSEMNASTLVPAHLLQIWILPEVNRLTPSYQDKHFKLDQKLNQWCLVAAGNVREQALKIQQDVDLYASVLSPETVLNYDVEASRAIYAHIVRGNLTINEQVVVGGDAIMVDEVLSLRLQASTESEVLLFDLPQLN